jgi:hypothetical protein
MAKTLIACYCEPEKASLNWQLHALYLSYCDLNSDNLDFRVTLPPGTESFIDRRIPFRVAPPIASQLKHPILREKGFDGYPYANHFLAVVPEDACYEKILLTDVDTLLLPNFLEQEPTTFLVGRGGYSTDYNHERLSRFARRLGYQRFGRFRNIGSTWFGDAQLVAKCAREALRLVGRLLYEEDWSGTEWPRWWIGVLNLYAAEIVLNERVDHLTHSEGVLDARPANEEDQHAIHLHMWHTADWQSQFSKHAFNAKRYKAEEIHLAGFAAYALKLARRGSAFRDLTSWRRTGHVQN